MPEPIEPSGGDAFALTRMLEDLVRPEAWPWASEGGVACVQTHASAVFLAGDRVVKLKKPVDLGFLDFSTRERRRAACDAECRLNARLAPRVYLGIVAVARGDDGRLRIEDRPPAPGADEEPGVLMRRLPPEASLASRVRAGTLDAATVARAARRIAAFHDVADAGPPVREASGWAALERSVRANLAEAETCSDGIVGHGLIAKLRQESERELAARRDLVDSRAMRGIGRDGHGDLRLDHVYVLDDPSAAGNDASNGDDDGIVVVDCIEFRDDFRRGDPVGDVAFLVMELELEGRADLAAAFFDAWSAARDDAEGSALLPLHVCHRHVVRGKVRSIESGEPEIPPDARERAADRARAHFVAGLAAIAPPARRPALVLTCGLPGSGKSMVARGLARDAGFVRVSSDETRKALASTADPAGAAGIYTTEWTDRTYAACLARARELLLEGERVVVDASFHESARRAAFLGLARLLHAPSLVLECSVDEAEGGRRLAMRAGDPSEASDADAAIRRSMAARWEPCRPEEAAAWRPLPTGPEPADGIARAIDLLRQAGLG